MILKVIFIVFAAAVIFMMISRIKALKKREEYLEKYAADVSHELKTPLAAMKVLADSLLSQEHAGEETYREFMRDISMEIDRENRLISDLMILEGGRSAGKKPDISEFSVNELAEDTVKMISPLAKENGITVVLECMNEVNIRTDRARLSDILINLVENAIKYNRPDGWVRINLCAEQRKCCIRVSDSGIGIPQEEQKKVFQRFYRVDKQHSREIGGTGLGLSIVWETVSMLGGTVELESREGEGSIFTVRIPL